MRKKEQSKLAVQVDARLAAAYRAAYDCTLGPKGRGKRSLATFMTGFVEDRLAEEIQFLDREASTGRE